MVCTLQKPVECGSNIALICGKRLWFPAARLKRDCECNCLYLQWSLSKEAGSLFLLIQAGSSEVGSATKSLWSFVWL